MVKEFKTGFDSTRQEEASFYVRKDINPEGEEYNNWQDLLTLTVTKSTLEDQIAFAKSFKEIESPESEVIAVVDAEQYGVKGKRVVTYGNYPKTASSQFYFTHPKYPTKTFIVTVLERGTHEVVSAADTVSDSLKFDL
jgi:hypothetical protein